MRVPILAAVLGVVAFAAHAFEIEDQTLFPADGPNTLRVISTADIDLFAPLVRSFQTVNPGVAVDYVTASSSQVMAAISDGAAFDVAISSAMDLQTKLANDGFALGHTSDQTEALPDFGTWRDQVFAFTQESAAIVISPSAFADLPIPETRQDLIAILRAHPDRFAGRVGTYDVRSSGLGYLFATQDARSSDTYWRLTEVMGSLGAQLYCCSSDMIEDVSTGRIAVAYNVLGSYAAARVELGETIRIIEPSDFTTLMLRSALIPVSAARPDLGGRFIDYLIAAGWNGGESGNDPFPPIDPDAFPGDNALRPIRLGPGLLVFLDRLKRQQFLEEWENAILQ